MLACGLAWPISARLRNAPGHLGLVIVLDFINMQDEFAVFAFHVGDHVGTAVFDALVFGVDDLGTVNFEVQQDTRDVNGNAFEDVFGGNVFLGHLPCADGWWVGLSVAVKQAGMGFGGGWQWVANSLAGRLPRCCVTVCSGWCLWG